MIEIGTDKAQYRIDILPESCPHCHRSIQPKILFGHVIVETEAVELALICPHPNCDRTFLANYAIFNSGREAYYSHTITQGNIKPKVFSENIEEISPKFVRIYNQANEAEFYSLDEICGVGYRKSLEFLIKDYLTKQRPDDEEIIRAKFLGPCINELVHDERIKTVAKRAVWLGNDETHYLRKWETKDLQDLKKLIDLTVHWIEMEMLTRDITTEMPG